MPKKKAVSENEVAAVKAPSKFVPSRKQKLVDLDDDNAVMAAAVNSISVLTDGGVVTRGQLSLFLTRVVKLTASADEVKEMIDQALKDGAIKAA